MDKKELYLVPIPSATNTYAPVSHRNVIDATLEQLYKHNLAVSEQNYVSARQGQQVIGYMDIKYDNNEELGMRLAFRNSYDKSMSVAFVAGASVWI